MKTDLVTGRNVPDETKRVSLLTYPNARPAKWPKADYIVGNPPFIGKSKVREDLGDGYAETLRETYPDVPDSADFVLYWWHKAALLIHQGKIRRFGLITTNSLRQTFNRRVVQRHLGKLSLVFAIPDHPWVDATAKDEKKAAVRIAMTVGVAGEHWGEIRRSVAEDAHADGSSVVSFAIETGIIAADLTIGTDLASTVPLRSNEGLTSMGVMLAGRGFILDSQEAAALAKTQPQAVGTILRPISNGRDLLDENRGAWVIDFTGLSVEEARTRYPTLFQLVLNRVKPERDANRDAQFREKWWLFGRWRPELREMTRGLPRYIAAVETAKHRLFHFLDAAILPEHRLIAFGSNDAFLLGVLSSRIHVVFALASGGTLEDRPVYNKTRCFDPFSFPSCDETAKARIRALGEELDAHRKRVQTKHPSLSLTAMYNVLEALRAGRTLTAKEQAIHDDGLVSILRQLHDELDAAVAVAYSWPVTLSDAEILTRLVALNAGRAAEEAAGNIRWLRPDYQAPASGGTQTGFGLTTKDAFPVTTKASKAKAPWPKTLAERVQVVERALHAAAVPVTADSLAKRFTRAKPSELDEILDTLAILGRAHLDEGLFSA